MALIDNLESYWKLDGSSADAHGSNSGTDTSVAYGVENISGFAETDPNSHLTLTASRVTYAGLINNEDAFLYKDFGADHFAGDFEHLVDFKVTSADDGGYVYIWGLTNSADDILDIQGASGSFLACSLVRTGSDYNFRILEVDSGAGPYYDTFASTVNTAYYLKIKRDETVGTYGTLYCYIYSDSARTNLVDTLEVALHTSKKDFRYLCAVSSRSEGTTSTINGYQENFIISGESYGKINQGAGFNGTTSKIVISDAASLKPTGNFSVAGWFKTSLADTSQFIFQSYSRITKVAGFDISINGADGKLRFLSGKNTGTTENTDWDDVYSASAVNDGNWKFFAAVYDGTYLNLYVNDSAVRQTSWANNPAYDAGNNVRIGCYNAQSTDEIFMNGSIDEVGIWSRALTSGEVTSLYNGGSGLAYPLSTGQTILVSESPSFTEGFKGNMDSKNSESVEFTETMSAVKAMLLSISESIGFTETLQSVQSHIVSISESINFTETMSALADLLTKSFKSIVRNSLSIKSKVKNLSIKSKLK